MSIYKYLVIMVLVEFCASTRGQIGTRLQYPHMQCKYSQEDTSNCPHGDTINKCGKRECLRGVNEKCDEDLKFPRYGKCADGLICCKTCMGCLNGQCDNGLCPPLSEINYFLKEHNVI